MHFSKSLAANDAESMAKHQVLQLCYDYSGPVLQGHIWATFMEMPLAI